VIDTVNKPFYKWCKELKKFDTNMSWFLLYLDKDLKYKYFIDLDGFIKPEDLPKYARFDSLINSINFTGVGDNAVITRQLKDA
jgi:Mg-chelatase subunit ChlD